MGVLRAWQWTNDPCFCLLTQEIDARWIRADRPFLLEGSFTETTETYFLCEFTVSQPIPPTIVQVRAYRAFRLWLDTADSQAAPLFDHTPTDGQSWNAPVDVWLPPLNSGRHRILISVTNRGGPPCLLASSPDLGLFTGCHWLTSGDTEVWAETGDVDDPPVNVPQQVKELGYPTSAESFHRVWPWLGIVFGLSFVWTLWSSRRSGSALWLIPDRLSAPVVRWVLLAAWWLLATNNIGAVTTQIGMDAWGHLEYVRYLIRNHRIPLASDGLQMFQSPLQYVLAAPLYSAASHALDPDQCARLLRIFPLFCGMAHVEIVFRSARRVFPLDDDRQVVALLVGGMMPMNLYVPQTFCNEPLAAFLTSVVLLQCLSLLRPTGELQGIRSFLRLGIVWGLALLTKVTPILLAPLIILTIACHGRQRTSGVRWHVNALSATLGTCLIVCGWYYGRNWVYMGSPFVGGADPSRGIVWFQDPGYRTWHQLTSFGTAMVQPVFAVAFGFWDGMYASMWSDGQLSGTLTPARLIPWNVDFLQVGTWTAIIPMGCLLLGLIAPLSRRCGESRVQLAFAVSAVCIYLAAILDHYMSVPFWSLAKSSYALGLLPCFSVIAAAGASAFLRTRLQRALLFAALWTWASASYCAFFCLK